MAQKVYMLTESEYVELTTKTNEPNAFLKQRVEQLEDELAKYKMFKQQLEQDSKRLSEQVIEQPIKITDRVVEAKKIADLYKGRYKTKTELYEAIGVIMGLSKSTIRKLLINN